MNTKIKSEHWQGKQMLFLFLCYFMGHVAVAQNNSQPCELLFNGKDLNGWNIVGNTGIANVVDGAISCQ